MYEICETVNQMERDKTPTGTEPMNYDDDDNGYLYYRQPFDLSIISIDYFQKTCTAAIADTISGPYEELEWWVVCNSDDVRHNDL